MSKILSIFSGTVSALIAMAVIATGVAVVADTAGWRFPVSYTTSQQFPTATIQSRVLIDAIDHSIVLTRPPAKS